MKQRKPLCRKDFLTAYVRAGLTYAQARSAYAASMRLIEGAVLSRTKVNFGNVCSIVPIERPPREVHKNFKKGEKEIFYLGRRVEFRVSIYKKFIETRQLEWFT